MSERFTCGRHPFLFECWPKEGPVLGLRLARLHRGLTQAQLGYRARMMQTTVSAIEVGRLNPTDDELHRLASALGIDDPCVLMRDFPDMTRMADARIAEATAP